MYVNEACNSHVWKNNYVEEQIHSLHAYWNFVCVSYFQFSNVFIYLHNLQMIKKVKLYFTEIHVNGTCSTAIK